MLWRCVVEFKLRAVSDCSANNSGFYPGLHISKLEPEGGGGLRTDIPVTHSLTYLLECCCIVFSLSSEPQI